jgi:hypothetical protein
MSLSTGRNLVNMFERLQQQALTAEQQMQERLKALSLKYPEARCLQDEIITEPTGVELDLPRLADEVTAWKL